MNNSLISIILPVYNGEKFLSEAIESFLNQTYDNFELIIVNDCSTDESLVIANSYAANDKRIKIINNSGNKKLPASLNIGHKFANGEYITWTSDDNIAKPTFLECLIETLKNSKAALVFSNYDMINSNGSLRREHLAGSVVNLIFGNTFGASFMYKKEVFEKLEGYNESLFLVEDYDFWLRASFQFTIVHLNKNLYQYRIHDSSLTKEIQENKKINDKYADGIKFMYHQVSGKLNWDVVTEKLMVMLHLGIKIDLHESLNSINKVLKDLEKYQLRIDAKDSVKNELWYLLRGSWKIQKEFQNISTLFMVLKICPKLLFFEEFSKKQTVLLMLKCLKKI